MGTPLGTSNASPSAGLHCSLAKIRAHRMEMLLLLCLICHQTCWPRLAARESHHPLSHTPSALALHQSYEKASDASEKAVWSHIVMAFGFGAGSKPQGLGWPKAQCPWKDLALLWRMVSGSFTWSSVSNSGIPGTKNTGISWKESSVGPQRGQGTSHL